MKKSILFVFSMAVLWLYVAVSMRSPVRVTLGEPSEAMQDCYLRARVGAVAEHGFSIRLDGEEISSDHCYMSDQMHLMMPVDRWIKTFGGTVTFVDENGACINGQYVPGAIKFGKKRKAKNIYIDLWDVAENTPFEVEWNDEDYYVTIETAQEEKLPAYYDLRDERMLGDIKNQGIFGTCWAFASTTALETTPDADGELYSADHMTMNSGYGIDPEDGGDTLMALSYLLSWKGPVYEWDDPYGDGFTDDTLLPVRHLQEARILTDGDRDKIKRMIMTYGGVESSIYMSISSVGEQTEDYSPYTAAYCYSGGALPNHDIVIVGWDDDYDRENFNRMPDSDGAFICRNSWGEDFGDEGYFYVSYEDMNLGNYNVAYTKLENVDNYDRNYQADQLGWIGSLGFSGPDAWFANVYEADSAQQIRAVGFYAVEDHTTFDIYLVSGEAPEEHLTEAVYVGSGQVDERGYYTVTLPEGFEVEEEERFAAVIHIHTEDTTRPVAIEYQAGEFSSTADLTDGEGYISYDGENWSNTETEYDCNVCLKVYTEENND